MGIVRIAPSAVTHALNLLRTVQYNHPPTCPCHSNPGPHHHHGKSTLLNQARQSLATPADVSREKEYAFEIAASSIRFGPGCTEEVGMDFRNLGSKRVCVVTDGNVC